MHYGVKLGSSLAAVGDEVKRATMAVAIL